MLVALAAGADSWTVFADGVISGFQKNANAPDTCSTELQTYVTDAAAVVADAAKVMGGDAAASTDLIMDCVKFGKAWSSYDGSCNFPALINSLSTLNTSQGWVDVAWRLYDNIDKVTADVDQMKKCDSDLAACGAAVGDVASIVLNFTI